MELDNSEPAHRSILIVAEHRRGEGTGHLRRCAELSRGLRGSVDWLLPETPPPGHHSRTSVLALLGESELPVTWRDRPAGPYDIVIVDRRNTTVADLSALPVDGIVLGLDMAGSGRDVAHYTIDMLNPPESIHEAAAPNRYNPGFLPLPASIRSEWPETITRSIVVFGGERAPGAPVGELLREFPVPFDLVVPPGTERPNWLPQHGNLVSFPTGLAEQLHRYDLVVTHYGITAWEATWARVPVLLVNPTSEHDRLAQRCGFVSADSAEGACRAVHDPDALVRAGRAIRPTEKGDLAALINALSIPPRSTSPIDKTRFSPVVVRTEDRTYFRHRETGLTFMQRFHPSPITYNRDYFFHEYQQQYGKTYLEDFDHIRSMGVVRLALITGHLRRDRGAGDRRPRLLDIGCAYGPFLRAAADQGIDAGGIDVAEDAVDYVKTELGLPAAVMSVMEMTPGRFDAPFDIVTMWYVIEHFPDLDLLLRNVGSVLRTGGVFAFSTPNRSGISGRRNPGLFLRRSPPDHYTVLDRRSTRAVLKRFGFRLRAFHSTGHHPERFGFDLGKPGTRRYWRRRAVLSLISRMFSLGDTFEAVAEKVE